MATSTDGNSFATVEEAMEDAERYCKRDGRAWIMKAPSGRIHIINPYSEDIELHYLKKAEYKLLIELNRSVSMIDHRRGRGDVPGIVQCDEFGNPVSGSARTEQHLARKFHDTYERLAPEFGYETRPDTKAFDLTSANGRLMVAVCKELLNDLPAFAALREVKIRLHFVDMPQEPMVDAGMKGKPHWIPDWRYEIDLLEHALHGSPRRYTERPRDNKPRHEIEPRNKA